MDVHAEVAGRLARTGGRYTRTRRRLVEILARAGMPLTLPDIVRGRRDLAPSSVYRNLAWLEDAGLIRRVASEDGFGRYELSEELTGHHHHLLCSSCGRIEDVDIPSELEGRLNRTFDGLARRAGFATVSHRLDLIGLCRACARA
jgi:Fur family ferric uptake transcriptional regulator